jgi:acetoin utilization deacetylase AcuC-like enzyme
VFGSTFESGSCGHYNSDMTNGFCFINNVAIAASYAKHVYRDKIKKVAIVDFDVHHGNGTQEIVECLKPKKFVVKSNA